MRLPFPFRLALLLLAALALLAIVVAVRLPDSAAYERQHAERASQIADLLQLQQAAHTLCNAQMEPERMRQAQRDLDAIWRRHPDWSHASAHAALKMQVAEFEDVIVHAQAVGPQRVMQSLNALLLAINREIAMTLDHAWRDVRQDPLRRWSLLWVGFSLFGALGALLIVSWLSFAVMARLRQVKQALGNAPEGVHSFDGLIVAAAQLRSERDACCLALNEAQ